MKNTDRVHKQPAKKIMAAQPQTPPPNPPAAVHQKHYALSLFEWTKAGDYTTNGEIDISREDYDRLNKISIQVGDYSYRGQAIFEKLLKIGFQAMLNADPSCELEEATATNNALLALMFDHMQLNICPGQTSALGPGTEAGTLVAGVSQLVNMCRERLNKATEVGL